MYQDGKQILTNTDNDTSIAVATTAEVFTPVFDLSTLQKLGLEIKATLAAGDVDVLVELYVSNDGTNFAEEDGYSDVINITDTTRHFLTIQRASLPAHKYGKLRLKGQGSNHADVVVAGFLNLVRGDL